MGPMWLNFFPSHSVIMWYCSNDLITVNIQDIPTNQSCQETVWIVRSWQSSAFPAENIKLGKQAYVCVHSPSFKSSAWSIFFPPISMKSESWSQNSVAMFDEKWRLVGSTISLCQGYNAGLDSVHHQRDPLQLEERETRRRPSWLWLLDLQQHWPWPSQHSDSRPLSSGNKANMIWQYYPYQMLWMK